MSEFMEMIYFFTLLFMSFIIITFYSKVKNNRIYNKLLSTMSLLLSIWVLCFLLIRISKYFYLIDFVKEIKYIDTVFMSIVLFMSLLFLVGNSLYDYRSFHRKKHNLILIGVMVPVLLKLIYELNLKHSNTSINIAYVLFICIAAILYCFVFIHSPNKIITVAKNLITGASINPIIFIDNSRVILDINEKMLDTFKLKNEELMGFSISDMSNEVFITIDIILDGIVRMDTFFIDIDNCKKFYKIHIEDVNDKRSKTVGKLITLIDMTENTEYEKAII